ncbi:hypothetical protein [Microbacterium sp.]|uniref:hypothetical protein n=1 Tax=Microbacterium sp. TaxID=51671 RepID=UPI003735BBF6
MVTRTRPAWPWVVLLLAAVIAGFLALTVWTGLCIDYVPESAAVSTCTMAPSLGWPGAIVVAGISLAVAVFSIVRLVRR